MSVSDGSSIASSQRTSASVRSVSGLRLLYYEFPVLPFLVSLESSYHRLISYTGLVIRMVQLFAFLFNSHYNHGDVGEAIGKAIYWTQLPFWDDGFIASYLWRPFLAFWCLAVVFLYVPLVVSVYLIARRIPTPRELLTSKLLRASLHAMTSILFIPLMQCFLSQVVCHNGTLWTFPLRRCPGTGGPLFVTILSIISLALLSFVTYVLETTVFVYDYRSEHPLARKHYLVNLCEVTWLIVTCVLYHVLLAETSSTDVDASSWFALYLALSTFCMLAAHVFFLPFVHHTTTRVHCAVYMVLALSALFVFVRCRTTVVMLGSFARTAKLNLDSTIAFSVACVMSVLGWWLADLRLNKEFVASLPQLHDAAAPYPPTFTCLFPRGLPEYDVVYRSTTEMCNEVADGAVIELRSGVSLETPYLTRIYLYTDVEVATRFVGTVWQQTGLFPTPEMLQLATRIFLKGHLRFKDSVSVLLGFASMITAFTTKRSLALAQCERTNAMLCSFPTRYCAYRLTSRLKNELQIRDAVYQHACEKVKRAHKDMLVRLHQFWNKLVTQQDRMQVFMTYSDIARVRRETNERFITTLQNPNSDRDILFKYADFLEQVMQQPERADKLRSLAEHEIEAKRHQHGRFLKSQDQSALDRRYLLRAECMGDGEKIGWCGIYFGTANILKIILTVLLVALGTAFVVATAVLNDRAKAGLECVQDTSSLRTMRMVGDMVTLQYWTLAATDPDYISYSFTSNRTRMHYINAIANDMRATHNHLLSLKQQSISGGTERLLYSPVTLSVLYAGVSKPSITTSSMLGLGYDYAQFLEDIPGVLGRADTTSSSPNTYVMKATESRIKESPSRVWEISAFNATVQSCIMSYTDEQHLKLIVFTVLFGIGLVLIVIYIEVLAMSNSDSVWTETTVNAFSHIPRRQLQELAAQAKLRIEQFDRGEVAEEDLGLMMPTAGAAREGAAERRSGLEEEGSGLVGQSDDNIAAGTTPGMRVSEQGSGSRNGDSSVGTLGEMNSTSVSGANHSNEDSALLTSGTSNNDGGSKSGTGASAVVSPKGPGSAAGTSISPTTTTTNANGAAASSKHNMSEEEEGDEFGPNAEDEMSGFGHSFGLDTGADDDEAESEALLGTTPKGGASSSSAAAARARRRRQRRRLAAQRASLRMERHTKASVQCVELFYVLLFVSVLLLTFVVGVYAFILGRNRDRTVANQLRRLIQYTDTLTSLYDTMYAMTTLLSQGSGGPEWVEVSEQLRYSIPVILATRPSVDEIALVRTAAIAIEQVATLSAKLDDFTKAPSEVVSVYDATTDTVTSDAASEAVRDSLFHETTGLVVPIHDAIWSSLQACLDYVNRSIARDVAKSAAIQVGILLLVGSSVTMALFLVMVFSLYQRFGRRYISGRKVALLVIAGAAIAVSLIAGGFFYHTALQLQSNRSEMHALANEAARTRRGYMRPLFQASIAAQQGTILNPVSVLDYFDDTESTAAVNAFISNRLQNDFATLGAFVDAWQQLLFFQNISMTLLSQSFIEHVADLASFDWNFDAEPDAQDVRLQYGDEPLRYTTKAKDLARKWQTLVLVARNVLTDSRAKDTLTTMHGIWADAYDTAMNEIVDKVAAIAERLYMCGMVASLAGFVSTVLSTVFIISFLLQRRALQEELERNARGITTSGRTRKQPWYTLLLILLLMAVPFALAICSALENYHLGTQLDYAHQRSLYIAQSMTVVEQWLNKAVQYTRNLQLTTMYWDAITELTMALSHGSLRIYNLDSELNNLLQGTNVLLPEEYRYGFNPNVTSAETRDNADATWVLPFGLDKNIAAWLESMEQLVSAPSDDAYQTVALNMRGAIMPLLRALEYSTDLLFTAQVGRISRYMYAELTVSIVLLLSVIFVHGASFIVLARREMDHLLSYRMLIKLIPRELRDKIPPSRDAHLLGLEGDGKNASDFSFVVSDVIAMPAVAINSAGIVVMFNRKAEEVFGYAAAEVLGSSAMMLMPPRVAAKYSVHMERFRGMHAEPTTRLLFRDIELHGQTKAGELVELRVTAHELRCRNGERVFLGYMENITDHHRLVRERDLNDFIIDHMPHPVIAIDTLGLMIRFNKAAERSFGRNAAETIDQNIKILLPEEIAVRHDYYLARYLRTRQRHIIDHETHAHAVRKNGQEFPVLVVVREVFSGNVPLYLGILRDLTDDGALYEALQMRDVLLEVSAVPMIVTDLFGRVLLYSRAAEGLFGYTAEEVVHNNCKMLMTDATEERHREYLEQYRNTWGQGLTPSLTRDFAGRHKDGTTLDLEVVWREVQAPTASFGALVGFFRDLSESRRREQRRAMDELIAEQHYIPLFVLDASGVIMRINHATEMEFGYAREELIGHSIQMLLLPESMRETGAAEAGTFGPLSGVGVSHENCRRFYAKRKSGTTFPVEARVKPSRDERGITLFVAFFRNMSRDVRTEQDEALTNFIMEASHTAMMQLNADGLITRCNEASEKLLNAHRTDILGRNLGDLIATFTLPISPNNDTATTQDGENSTRTVQNTQTAAAAATTTTRGTRYVINTSSSTADHNAARHSTASNTSSMNEELPRITELIDIPVRCQIRCADRSTIPVDITVKEIVPARLGERGAFAVRIHDARNDDALAWEKRRNEAITELLSLPVVHFTWEGKLTAYNVAAERQLGWRASEMLGQDVRRLFLDAHVLDNFLPVDRRAAARVAEPRRRTCCTRAKTRHGAGLPVLLTVHEIVAEHDRLESFYVAFFNDLTGPLELQAASQTFQAHMELLPDGVVVLNAANRVVCCNRATCETFGYAEARQLVGLPVHALIEYELHHHNPQYYYHNNNNTAAAIEEYDTTRKMNVDSDKVVLEVDATEVATVGFAEAFLRSQRLSAAIDAVARVRCTRANGTRFPAELSLMEVNDVQDGAVYVCRIKDFSAPAQVDYAAALLRSALHISSDPVLILDENGTIQSLSRSTASAFGYDDIRPLMGQMLGLLVCDPTQVRSGPNNNSSNTERAASLTPEAATRGVLTVTSYGVQEDIAAATNNTSNSSSSSRKRAVLARRRDGSTFGAELWLREIVLKERHVYVAHIINTTTTNELHAKRKLNMAIVEHSPMPILVCNASGLITLFSPAAERLFGLTSSEVIGTFYNRLLVPHYKVAARNEAEDEEDAEDNGPQPNKNNIITTSTSNSHRTIVSSRRADDSRRGHNNEEDDGNDDDEEEEEETLGQLCNTATTPSSWLRGARMKSGIVVPVQVHAHALPAVEEGGESQYVLYLVSQEDDVAVERATRLSAAVLRGLPDAALIISHSGHILHINQPALQLCGHEVNELVGQPISLVMPHERLLALTRSPGGLASQPHTTSNASNADDNNDTNMDEHAEHAMHIGTESGLAYTFPRVTLFTKQGGTIEVRARVCEMEQADTIARHLATAHNMNSSTSLEGAALSTSDNAMEASMMSMRWPKEVYCVMLTDLNAQRERERCEQRYQALLQFIETPTIVLAVHGKNTGGTTMNMNISSETPRAGDVASHALLRPSYTGIGGGSLYIQALNTSAEQLLGQAAAELMHRPANILFTAGNGVTRRLQRLLRDAARLRNGVDAGSDDDDEANDEYDDDADNNEDNDDYEANLTNMNSGHESGIDSDNAAAAAVIVDDDSGLDPFDEELMNNVLLDGCRRLRLTTRVRTATAATALTSIRDPSDILHSTSHTNTTMTSHIQGARGLPNALTAKIEAWVMDREHVLLQLRQDAADRTRRVHGALFRALAQSAAQQPFLVVKADDSVVAMSAAAENLFGCRVSPSQPLYAQEIIEGGVVGVFAERRTLPTSSKNAAASRSPVYTALDPTSAAARGELQERTLHVDLLANSSWAEVWQLENGTAHSSSININSSHAAAVPPAMNTSVEDERALGQNATTTVVAAPTLRAEIRTRVITQHRRCRRDDGTRVMMELCFYELCITPNQGLNVHTATTGHSTTGMESSGPQSQSSTTTSGTEGNGAAAATAASAPQDVAQASWSSRHVVVFVKSSARAAQQLQSSKIGRYIMEHSPDAVVVANEHGVIESFNAAAEQLFNFVREHIIGKKIDLLFVNDGEICLEGFAHYYARRCRRAAGGGVAEEVLAERRDGATFTAVLHVQEVRAEGGMATKFVVHLRARDRTAV